MHKEELDIIRQAILNEIEGYEFYKLASTKGSEGIKAALKELADEELKHVEFLKTLFEVIDTNDSDEMKLELQEAPSSPGIFKWEKVGKELNSFAMSVFSIGMQMEKDSIEFYQNAKDLTNINAAKELFDILIEWEKVHLDQFTTQYNLYKEEWWAEQSFSPF